MTALAEGRLAEGTGDLDGAARAYRRAAELGRRGGILPETGCAEILLGRALATIGRGDEARAYLREARRILDRAPEPGTLVHTLAAAERGAGRKTAPRRPPMT